MKVGGEHYNVFSSEVTNGETVPRKRHLKSFTWNLFLHCKTVSFFNGLRQLFKKLIFKMPNIVLEGQYQCDIFAAIKIKIYFFFFFPPDFLLIGNYDFLDSLF